jgi:hypothetical protein
MGGQRHLIGIRKNERGGRDIFVLYVVANEKDQFQAWRILAGVNI